MSAIRFGLRLVSVANEREHWARRAKRTQEHRFLGATFARKLGVTNRTLVDGPIEVTIRRIAPRALDDDNLRSACKALRDGIADAIGVPDNDPRVAWRYEQSKGRPREHAVQIAIAYGSVATSADA